MTLQGGGVYRGTSKAYTQSGDFKYAVEAWDNRNNQRRDPASGVHTVPINPSGNLPKIGVVGAQQQPGATLVEVEYELGPAEVGAAQVSVAFSQDGGARFDIQPAASALSGDVGSGVAPGRRRLVWDASRTLPVGTFGANFVARVSATSGGGTASGISERFTLDLRLGTVHGLVITKDARGVLKGPADKAQVELQGPEGVKRITTGADGTFKWMGLPVGDYKVTASLSGYESATREFALRAGESPHHTLVLMARPAAGGMPIVTDFSSPQGRYFIPGLPGNLTFTAEVAWNGSPGRVFFDVAGVRYPAEVVDLGWGRSKVTLRVPAPSLIPAWSELSLDVVNGEGRSFVLKPGIHFHPLPGLVASLYGPDTAWVWTGKSVSTSRELSVKCWSFEGPAGVLSSEAAAGWSQEIRFDPLAGNFSESVSGVGSFSLDLEFEGVENLQGGRASFRRGLELAFGPEGSVKTTGGWEFALFGKAGVGAPAVLVLDGIVPGLGTTASKLPVIGDLKLRLFFISGGSIWAVYAPGEPVVCWFGANRFDASLTAGFEGQAALAVKWLPDTEAGVYIGGTGSPEFTICPELKFNGITFRLYVGYFVSSAMFEYSNESGIEYRFEPASGQRLHGVPLGVMRTQPVRWRPVADRMLRWGDANRLPESESASRAVLHGPSGAESAVEQAVVENVIRSANPSVVADAAGTQVAFVWHDPQKPWHAATDIGLAWRPAGGAWTLGRVVDDTMAEFSPRLAAGVAGLRLGAWLRVMGDVSGARGPEEIPPHFEVVSAWQDTHSGLWTEPMQLTTNAVVDRDPLPVVIGRAPGVVWVQNVGTASPGHRAAGDRLMFSSWFGSTWTEPVVLWAGDQGVLGLSFAADATGQGHLVFAVDEDGNLDTREDRELYALSTVNGRWQPARRLTQDTVEDASPVLVAPNGVPRCVWRRAGGQLTHTALSVWQPRPVFEEQTPANEAPSLDGVTLPGGAAVAYTVQTPEGVDVFAALYDATLDRWSLPRQLTHDEHAESALALDFDGRQLVLAYLKTQTVRTNLEVEINGQQQMVQNVPLPGRTDLYLLRQPLGQDLAVEEDSFQIEPAEPVPGTNATLQATVVNRGERPLPEVRVAFYDGDPGQGGVLVGEQTLAEVLVGGARRTVSVPWNVPTDGRPHDLYVVADPALALEDRDRANNLVRRRTLLPELNIETCWSDPLSDTAVLLVTRVRNTGQSAAGPFDLAWRVGAINGAEIGRRTLEALAPGAVAEIAFTWETGGRQDLGEFTTVYAMVDAGAAVEESDETNNAYSQTVRVIPGWAPRLVEARLLPDGRLKLVFTAGGGTAADFALEGTVALSGLPAWEPEAGAVIVESEPGRFEAELERRGPQRYYRVRWVR